MKNNILAAYAGLFVGTATMGCAPNMHVRDINELHSSLYAHPQFSEQGWNTPTVVRDPESGKVERIVEILGLPRTDEWRVVRFIDSEGDSIEAKAATIVYNGQKTPVLEVRNVSRQTRFSDVGLDGLEAISYNGCKDVIECPGLNGKNYFTLDYMPGSEQEFFKKQYGKIVQAALQEMRKRDEVR